jgi:NRAMP (natural resistance-associated macrophage protein)-like metal ion transporter
MPKRQPDAVGHGPRAEQTSGQARIGSAASSLPAPSSWRQVWRRLRRTEPALPGVRELEIAGESSRIKRLLRVLGPGLITGASDDDPAGVATYSVAGASLGLPILWVMLFTMPLMTVVQYVCAKVGLVTSEGLAGVLKRHYSLWVLYPVVGALVIANAINIGADLGAIAAAIDLIIPVYPGLLIVPVSTILLLIVAFGSYKLLTNLFKWLTLALLGYVGTAIVSGPDLGEVLRATFIPTISLDTAFLTVLVAILGTTISPYLFFWQASEEVDAQVAIGRRRLWQRRGTSDKELRYAAWDTIAGMFISNLVAYSVVLGTASTLFRAGKTNVGSAADAAQALRPIVGDAAFALFAVGIVGAGLLAVPVLAGSSAYALSETFGWRSGLGEPPGRAPQFYGVIAVSTLLGMLINFAGIKPIDALVWSAVVNGLVAPPILVLIMITAGNRRIMGDRINGRTSSILGWFTTLAMLAAAIGLILTWVQS